MPEITVVIPCYNYGRFLDEAVASVLAQSFRDFEIIVVDDGSTDPETRALLDGYERPQTTVLRTGHHGAPAARNTGIRASNGKYLCNLDADDKLHPRYLEKTRALLEADDEHRLGFVTTWLRKFGRESETWKPEDYSPLRLAMTCNVHGSSLFRREAWEAVDGYRDSFTGAEDWNLWINIVAAGYEWAVVEEDLLHYRRHGHSRSHESLRNRSSIFEAIVADNAEFYRRHHRDLLALFYRQYVELDNVWHEKHVALEDNKRLLDQLETERKARRDTVEVHRQLEDHCQSLTQEERAKSAFLDRLAKDYRELESYCRSLEREVREKSAFIDQLAKPREQN